MSTLFLHLLCAVVCVRTQVKTYARVHAQRTLTQAHRREVQRGAHTQTHTGRTYTQTLFHFTHQCAYLCDGNAHAVHLKHFPWMATPSEHVDAPITNVVDVNMPDNCDRTSSLTGASADFVCKLCERRFTRKQSVKRHARMMHIKAVANDNYNECVRHEPSSAFSQRKRPKNAPKQSTEDDEGNEHRFKCEQCGSMYRMKHGLKQHMMSRHSSATLKCDMCQKVSCLLLSSGE